MNRYHTGFTLVEVIATLIIACILGTMIYSYFVSSVANSVIPVTRLKKSFALQSVMENITADYNARFIWEPATIYAADEYCVPTTPNDHIYHSNGGTSSTIEPAWPLASGGTVSDSTIIWTESGFGNELTILKNKIGIADANLKDNDYGKYYVKENKFIKFVAGVENDIAFGDPKDILKVIIKNEGGTLTALFTLK